MTSGTPVRVFKSRLGVVLRPISDQNRVATGRWWYVYVDGTVYSMSEGRLDENVSILEAIALEAQDEVGPMSMFLARVIVEIWELQKLAAISNATAERAERLAKQDYTREGRMTVSEVVNLLTIEEGDE